ncbi:MAG TPA: DDE-type integrase/transposase/recombinase [Polyangiaceae bacterium]|nr:DDE-type integrase/transposase/recombinase [Polyangiaceae bacterium]
MPGIHFIPLPRDWKRRIKSALLCAIGLERLALAEVRAGFEHSSDPRAKMAAELDALRELIAVQAEELRLCRARVACLPPQQRPHYPPVERLAILMLRSHAGWNAAETARRFLVTSATIASWMRRLDQGGEQALVKTPAPVNRFDDAVTLLVQKLHRAAPSLGRRKLADVLARAGLVLAASTAKRMLRKAPPELPGPPSRPARSDKRELTTSTRVVTAKRPHHVWHADITSIRIGASGSGFWTPWWPFALVLRWVMSWHIAVVVDHFSRALLAFSVFREEPTAAQLCALLDRAVSEMGAAPRYLVTDRGAQFGHLYRAWCARHGVKPRFGAIGKKGSIALVERFILSLKREWLWKVFVPASLPRMQALLDSYQRWYNHHRPHAALSAATPSEILRGAIALPARRGVRVERLARYRRCATARAGPKLKLVVSYVDGHQQLPVVLLRHAA